MSPSERTTGIQEVRKEDFYPPPKGVPEGTVPQAIRLVRPDADPVVVPLDSERIYVIGRGETSALYFMDNTVSRRHGVLYFSDKVGAWTYRDERSLLGSFIGEGMMAQQEIVAVVSGNVLRLGSGGSQIEFLAEAPSGSFALSPEGRGVSSTTRALEESIRVASRHTEPLLLLGESGAGKTFIARRIHELSGLPGRFVSIDCTQLPTDRTTLHSELLGHVRGAFTGAADARPGQLFLADGGTLFLDEVESLTPDAQGFLLTLLEGEGDLVALGAPGNKGRARPRFRLIAASKQRLNESALRKDLAQRLAGGDFIHVPSLAERREDIPALVDRFLRALLDEQQIEARVSPEAMDHLMVQPWPGQVRELRATVRATALRAWVDRVPGGNGPRVVVRAEDIERYLRERSQAFGSRAPSVPSSRVSARSRKRPVDFTRDEVAQALRAAGQNRTHAAEALGIPPRFGRRCRNLGCSAHQRAECEATNRVRRASTSV